MANCWVEVTPQIEAHMVDGIVRGFHTTLPDRDEALRLFRECVGDVGVGVWVGVPERPGHEWCTLRRGTPAVPPPVSKEKATSVARWISWITDGKLQMKRVGITTTVDGAPKLVRIRSTASSPNETMDHVCDGVDKLYGTSFTWGEWKRAASVMPGWWECEIADTTVIRPHWMEMQEYTQRASRRLGFKWGTVQPEVRDAYVACEVLQGLIFRIEKGETMDAIREFARLARVNGVVS